MAFSFPPHDNGERVGLFEQTVDFITVVKQFDRGEFKVDLTTPLFRAVCTGPPGWVLIRQNCQACGIHADILYIMPG
jgi:hypothetical protein